MSDLISVPTVEQINLEHRLANSKANEAVQHAANCGLMLLQVKASKQHGEWLPWLNGEIEAGRLEVGSTQARVYMRVASNKQRGVHLENAPSIRAALELLSDKEPTEQQGTLIDIEAERKAREEAEAKAETERQARELFERRAQESQAESNERRKRIRELENQIGLLENRPAEIQIQTPADYEETKRKAAESAKELAELKRQQTALVQKQVAEKLKERDAELSAVDRKIAEAEARLSGLQQHIDRYSHREQELKIHMDVIEKTRVALAYLAANLEGFESVIDSDNELRQWRALSQMLKNGAAAIDYFAGDHKPALSLIRGAT